MNIIADNIDSTNRHHGVYQEYGKINLQKKKKEMGIFHSSLIVL